jgi:hypothetical protein
MHFGKKGGVTGIFCLDIKTQLLVQIYMSPKIVSNFIVISEFYLGRKRA